jgi:hypothetical protein
LELKLFGTIGQQCKDDLDLLESLTEQELKKISQQISVTADVFPAMWRDSSLREGVSLDPQQLDRQTGSLLFYAGECQGQSSQIATQECL